MNYPNPSLIHEPWSYEEDVIGKEADEHRGGNIPRDEERESDQEQVENQYVQEVRDEGVWEGDGGVAGRGESQ